MKSLKKEWDPFRKSEILIWRMRSLKEEWGPCKNDVRVERGMLQPIERASRVPRCLVAVYDHLQPRMPGKWTAVAITTTAASWKKRSEWNFLNTIHTLCWHLSFLPSINKKNLFQFAFFFFEAMFLEDGRTVYISDYLQKNCNTWRNMRKLYLIYFISL